MMNNKSAFFIPLSIVLLALVLIQSIGQKGVVHGFVVSPCLTRKAAATSAASAATSCRKNDNSYLQSSSDENSNSDNNVIATIDVSDLNLTMEDLNKPLPKELLMGLERSGYQSTSRIPSIEDNGCYWVENAKDSDKSTIDVTLAIPGLRGQPAACLSVLFSTTTISVTAFGRVVWSCIQRGSSVPEGCSFLTEDGKDMIPVIQLSVEKKDKSEVWDGFILQVGEDSIL